MKKGNTIRLEIIGKDENGMLLHSNLKKQDTFLPRNEIKNQDYIRKNIGDFFDVRIVSSRPKLIVSGKFVHDDEEPIIDYVPKVVEEPKTDEESLGFPVEKRERSIIENKRIVISKNNEFDKGWTLFRAFDLPLAKNRFFTPIVLSNVIRLITHSDVVDIILSEECLSSRIIDELEWANKYIKINLICKTKAISERYKKLTFNTIKIDQIVDFNYLGIIGKETGYFLVNDGFNEIDDSIEKVYFQGKNLKGDFSFVRESAGIVILDAGNKKDYSDLIKETKKAKTELYYIVNVANFDADTYRHARENNIRLLTSEITREGILSFTREGKIYYLTMTQGGFFVSHQIESINSFVGKTYLNYFSEDNIATKSIPSDAYYCYEGVLRKLDIKPTKQIDIDVNCKTMDDFVHEIFDSSIVDNHNDYSAEAKKVDYEFTLIPPLVDDSFVESSIYDGIKKLRKQWDKYQNLRIENIKNDYSSFLDKDFGLIEFLNNTVLFTHYLCGAVDNCDYRIFYSTIGDALKMFRKAEMELKEIFVSVFNNVNENSSVTKFDKFDDEIAGYKQTIAEKSELVKKGIDVLNNKRRVEILTKKIEDLNLLKKKFEGSSTSRNDKSLSVFTKKYDDLISKKKIRVNDDSIGNIVKPKEETKASKLDSFLDNYLVEVHDYILNCIDVLSKLIEEHIPEEYKVLEKDSQRYIVILKEEEYHSTIDLRKEFEIECLTRR